jgi:hypothetical protein
MPSRLRLSGPPAHLSRVKLYFALACLEAASVFAAVPRGCTGSTTLGTFRVSVLPPEGRPQGCPKRGGSPCPLAAALPVKAVSQIPAGSRLEWAPAGTASHIAAKAEVAGILLPEGDGDLVILEPRKAAVQASWELSKSPQVLAVIYGPQGLSMGKVKSLVEHNRELLAQLADYAQQTSEVETLVDRLAASEQSGGSADAVLKGFSSQYGVSLPKLDSKAPTDQQASLLLKALMPAANSYDPLAPGPSQMQQSVGLAASLAGLFFGNPVALAAGGTELFANLKTVLFPATEFRSAFAQTSGKDDLALCAKTAAAKSRTRLAYLWAYRVPGLKPPAAALAGPAHMPLGSKSLLKLKPDSGSNIKDLARAREWRLMPVAGGTAIPVPVEVASAPDTIEVDLSKTTAAPGDYRLSALWDWGAIAIDGVLHLHRYGDFSRVQVAPESHDRLVAGNGIVAVKLTGTDFEFVEKAAIEKASGRRLQNPAPAEFTLPLGKRAGEQDSMEVEVDTAAPGPYRLLITQSDSLTHEVPVTVLPPNPKIANLPVRANVGEARQAIRLEGTGMDRIESISTPAGEITGNPYGGCWKGEIRLNGEAVRGRTYPISIRVKGLQSPLEIADAVRVLGPRPKIESVRKSAPADMGIEIREDELPAGTALGLVLSVDNIESAGSRPDVEFGCEGEGLKKILDLSPPVSGPGSLYVSVDPGAVGYPGCRLTATVKVDPEGSSDAYILGRVVRLPQLEQFTLTGEQIGPSVYAGILTGRDLDLIAKAGWDAKNGVAVDAIPAPVPAAGDPSRQTLRLALPWPAPAPHAPLYVWLRGESEGRKTGVAF